MRIIPLLVLTVIVTGGCAYHDSIELSAPPTSTMTIGAIDDVRIYTHNALTPSDIENLFNSR